MNYSSKDFQLKCCFSPDLNFNIYINCMIVIACVIAWCGIICNATSVVVLLHARRKHNNIKSSIHGSFTALIINLTICDTIVPLCPFLYRVLSIWLKPHMGTFCLIQYIMMRYPQGISYATVGAIAVNRCLSLWYNKASQIIFGTKSTVPFLLFLWISYGMFWIFYSIGPIQKQTRLSSDLINSSDEDCSMTLTDQLPKSGRIYWFIAVLLPLFVTFTSSLFIVIKTRKSLQAIKNMGSASTVQQLYVRERRLTIRIISLVLLQFFTIAVPFILAYFFFHTMTETVYIIMLFIYNLYYPGNFLIYVFRNPEYKDAFMLLVTDIRRSICCCLNRSATFEDRRNYTGSFWKKTTKKTGNYPLVDYLTVTGSIK